MSLSAELQEKISQAARGSYDRKTMDVLDHVLFDENSFQATTARLITTFFSVAQGGSYLSGNKTAAETNMQLQGQLPSNQHFVATEISIALKAILVGADTDMNTVISAFLNIVQASVFSLKLAGRDFDTQVPGSVFMPPVFGTAINSAANAFPVGGHTASGWMKLSIPVVIEGGAAFSVVQQTQSASSANTTILDTASGVLATQVAALQVRMKGTLVRFK